MRPIRLLALVLLAPLCAQSAQSAEDADDWKMIGGMLALVQQVVHLAANSPDGDAAQKKVEAILSGADAQANRMASGVLDEVLQDVPAEQRTVFVAIGRDLLTLARREQERQRAEAASGGARQPESRLVPPTDPLQARKDLQAMGLRYWDEQQFLEAVRRGDRIAVDLYLAGRGLQSAETPRNPQPAR